MEEFTHICRNYFLFIYFLRCRMIRFDVEFNFILYRHTLLTHFGVILHFIEQSPHVR